MLHLSEPYRVFFPLGLVFGLAGVAIWPLYSFGVTATYSGRSHTLVQIFGFLYAFIAGFLLTAVPRFTGTRPPARVTQVVLAALLTVAVVASELRAFAVGTAAFVVAHAMLLTLVGRRVVRRQQSPPPTFVQIGLALVAGAAGAVLMSAVAFELIPASWDLLGKRLLTEGMVMLLVLGVGGFLGPRLLGFASPPIMTCRPRSQRPQRWRVSLPASSSSSPSSLNTDSICRAWRTSVRLSSRSW